MPYLGALRMELVVRVVVRVEKRMWRGTAAPSASEVCGRGARLRRELAEILKSQIFVNVL